MVLSTGTSTLKSPSDESKSALFATISAYSKDKLIGFVIKLNVSVVEFPFPTGVVVVKFPLLLPENGVAACVPLPVFVFVKLFI